jgi:hypothetical protein
MRACPNQCRFPNITTHVSAAADPARGSYGRAVLVEARTDLLHRLLDSAIRQWLEDKDRRVCRRYVSVVKAST